ncbi:MAG: hypothetical protein HW405_556 [Candidatus Berkelbacteria bacterium]|nr:hypothetical protein [Candidatus Berkelbacteria bacterium]
MTETIQDISREIDTSVTPEQIQVEIDQKTGKLVEFHRVTFEEKVA